MTSRRHLSLIDARPVAPVQSLRALPAGPARPPRMIAVVGTGWPNDPRVITLSPDHVRETPAVCRYPECECDRDHPCGPQSGDPSRTGGARTPAVAEPEAGLAGRVAGLLAELGGSAAAVAATLQASWPPVWGWPGDVDMDPIGRWLARRDDRLRVWLSGTHVHAEGVLADGLEVALVPLPPPVLEHRQACAAGHYEDLWLPVRDPADDDFTLVAAGPAGWGLTHPVGRGADEPTVAVPAAAATANPGRYPGGGRGLAHLPYADAVVHALDLRGVAVAGYWPAPPCGDDGRTLTVELDPAGCGRRWPAHTAVLLRWTERAGWQLQPLHGGRPDPQGTVGWWDARGHATGTPKPAAGVLPDPDRLAAWVAATLAGRRYDEADGVIFVARPGTPTVSWRAAWPTAVDPDFETALDLYRSHAGHRIARTAGQPGDPIQGGTTPDVDHRF